MLDSFEFSQDILDIRPPPDGNTRLGDEQKAATLARQAARREMNRAKGLDQLRALFPRQIAEEQSHHFLTAGGIHCLAFLTCVVENFGPLRDVLASTWTMAREDVHLLRDYLTERRIGRLTLFTGEYFTQREPALYATVLDMLADFPDCRFHHFRNHAKLLICRPADNSLPLVVESSANFANNPRTEQTVVTRSAPLADFYSDWFEDVVANA